MFGSPISGICNTIIGCIQPTVLPDGSKSCLACNPTSFWGQPANNGSCQCLMGELVNDICNSVPGCIAPGLAANGSVICLACSASTHFNPDPQPDGLCACQQKYTLGDGICSDTCGDGYLFSSSLTACDDGNTLSGDGCSSACQVESRYRCENGSSTSASICYYIGSAVTLALQSITKTEGQNQGVFKFSVSPALTNLEKLNLTTYLTFNCATNYTVASSSYTPGTLSVAVDYSADLEGKNCSMSLAFNYSLARSPTFTLDFTAHASGEALSYSASTGGSSAAVNSGFLFKTISYMTVLLFLLSMPHKLAGAELIVACQVVYLSYGFFP
jgi:cysteine-rich repeat protein